MTEKVKVFLTSNVFSPNEIGSNEKISKNIRDNIKNLWEKLNNLSTLKVYNGRFPKEDEMNKIINEFKPNIMGCHLSHPISTEMIENSDIFAIATSTAGYNHIQRTSTDDILITHTPGVLHDTVADYTVAIIMSNLRNLIDLHNYVWNDNWTAEDKWDLDQDLSSIINIKVLGIIGLGEIGKEIVKRLYPWGIKIIYYDIKQWNEFEQQYPNIEFRNDLKDVFKESDIVSVHVPLNKHTEKLVNRDLLKLMKQNALLVNTARGPIVDFDALLDLLEKEEITINLASDVFPIEPLDEKTLKRLKSIKKQRPNIRMVLIPHNASADADTRGKMDILFLEDIIRLIESSNLDDLKDSHIIPEHRRSMTNTNWKIINYWKSQ
jgi:lactate dehydrogenase-like 2-hydroxyacid dehydrogenase